MGKGILFGNGLNSRIGISGLRISDIQARFKTNVIKMNEVFGELFGISFSENVIDSLFDDSNPEGIEVLAGRLYEYINANTTMRKADNLEIRLQDVVTYVSLTSIFFDDNGIISQSYDKSKMIDLSQYSEVFSLNYYEFWDDRAITHYLHGYLNLREIKNEKKTILASPQRMKLPEYSKAFDVIAENNNVLVIQLNNIIFAPSTVSKNKLICVQGIHPSNNLFPANDLFMFPGKELYKELDKVEQIDVFGMSPYGDQSLIDVLNTKKKVRVFVYTKDSNKETDDWKRKLTCPYEILDSSEI